MYDPKTDPRYVPPRHADPDDLAAAIGEIEAELAVVDECYEMFQTDAWAFVMGQIRKEYDLTVAQADRSHQHGEWHLLRGQMVGLGYLLELPDRLQKRRRRLMDDHRRFVGEE